jgi:photosystem II stability/assembly factor-like uncharacterized protein
MDIIGVTSSHPDNWPIISQTIDYQRFIKYFLTKKNSLPPITTSILSFFQNNFRMRTIQNLLCAATILCWLPTQITAQVWAKTETNQPHGTGTLNIDVVDKNTVWATHDGGWVTALDDVKISRTIDGGANWTTSTVTTNDNEWVFSLDAKSASECWILTYNLAEGGSKIYVTKNGGQTWTRKGANTFPAPTGFGDGIQFLDSQNGVVFGDPVNGEFEIYRTSDGGETWVQVEAAKIPDAFPGEFGVLVGLNVHDGKYLMLADGNRLIVSSDKGLSWTSQQLPSQPTAGYPGGCNAMAFSDAMNGMITYSSNNGTTTPTPGFSAKPIRTTDGGLTWSVITNTNLDQFQKNTLLTFVPGTTGTFVAGSFDGWYYTKDYGVTWTHYEDKKLQMATIKCLDWQTCYGSIYDQGGDTDGDVARLVGTILAPSGLNTPYFSTKVWPNPTQGDLNVTLPNGAYDYDINCYLQDITTGKIEASGVIPAGSTTVYMDCSSAPPGVYSLRMVSGKRVQTAMVFLKMY